MHPILFTIPGINFPVPSYGAMVLLAFLGGVFWMTRRAKRVKMDPDMVLNLAFIALISSTLGARIFYVLHYWDEKFADNPSRAFSLEGCQSGGFEIYGGLIGGFVCCYLYLWIRRQPLRLWADLTMPSLLFGMGVGRIGCFLFGCCWGSTCPATLPWAVHFPFGSPPHQRQWEQRRITVPAELLLQIESENWIPLPRELMNYDVAELTKMRDRRIKMLEEDVAKAKEKNAPEKIAAAEAKLALAQESSGRIFDHLDRFGTTIAALRDRVEAEHLHSLAMHPAQLYSAIGPLLLALLTNAYFYRRRRHGLVMVLGFGIYSIERFIEEIIRSDNPHDTFGLTISQGVSIGVLAICVLMWFVLHALPEKSPAASRAAPPPPKPKKGATEPAPTAS